MNITDLLNSGALHAAARERRPECVDRTGNVHGSAERAQFVDWRDAQKATHGNDVSAWPADARAEYAARYVPSH